MTREQLVMRLQQEYATRREDNLRAYDTRVDAACDKCEGLRALLDERRTVLMSGIRNAMFPASKDPQANTALPGTLADYNARIAAKLAGCGLPADALAPVYTCTMCKDEGYVYTPTRHMCECFERELNCRMLEALGLKKTQTFETYSEAFYSEDAIVGKVSQRTQMRMNRDICERFADSYPATEVRDLLFTGKSGLGKTFLMQAIAHRVTQRGYSVQYVSAYKLLETMRKAYFENNSELMQPLMDAPLLLIDDLGTEPLMENITVTQLFNLLNERQNAERHTIISTNLNVTDLKARYTERVTSRLIDESRCRIVRFIGEDVRQKLSKPAPAGANGGKA